MSSIIYTAFTLEMVQQTLDLANDTIRIALLADTYEPDKDHASWSAIKAHEITGVGYVANGALASITVAKDDIANNVKVSGNDVTWLASTLTARYAVIYKVGATDALSPLIHCVDFGANKSSINGNFSIQWADGVIFTIGQAV